MSWEDARRLLAAELRPPCRRGDLDSIAPGQLVALIDGVFHQEYAVSPKEVLHAVQRGVVLFGSASMGALRAAEVPSVHGIGRVYEMYRDGLIDSDDEVAVCYDPDSLRSLTVPLVNVRHATQRLVATGTIGADIGRRIVEAAQGLHYTERTYRRILQAAGLASFHDVAELQALLNATDLKRDDAVLLLELLERYTTSSSGADRSDQPRSHSQPCSPEQPHKRNRLSLQRSPDAPVEIWEIGGTVSFDELLQFLQLSGKFDKYARMAVLRLLLDDREPQIRLDIAPLAAAKSDFLHKCGEWGWNSDDEVRIVTDDLGLGVRDALSHFKFRAVLDTLIRTLSKRHSPSFLRAIRAALFDDDLALKREAMRCESLRTLGASSRSPDSLAVGSALIRLCAVHGLEDPSDLHKRLATYGITKRRQTRLVRSLAVARAKALALCTAPASRVSRLLETDASFGLWPTLKPERGSRFGMSMEEAITHARRLQGVIGATRVGMINTLSDLSGVYISQVARPEGAWSSSYGSGKGQSKDAAVVGGIMEELEKWAQEQFSTIRSVCSFREMRKRRSAVNPCRLDLPYDSEYHETLKIAWVEAADLLRGGMTLVPAAAVACPSHAGPNNIYYSRRGARVVFSTNGLASGFSLAEAVLHATCEYIERHAATMCELRLENPGVTAAPAWPRRIALDSLPAPMKALVDDLRTRGYVVDMWNATSEVRVPTVMTQLTRDRQYARGWASHPDAGAAAHMSVLEACQTLVSAIAGGREDLTVRARSLGRHERSRPRRRRAEMYWRDDPIGVPLSSIGGLCSQDIYEEVCWVRDRLRDAGIRHLLTVDLSRPELAPARVVRVVIPGLETINPFHYGHRARAALLWDLVSPAP